MENLFAGIQHDRKNQQFLQLTFPLIKKSLNPWQIFLTKHKDLFDDSLSEKVDSNATPVIKPPRKIPVAGEKCERRAG